MKIRHAFSIVAYLFCGGLFCLANPAPDKPIPVRVASYNVEFSKSATPEQIGEMFKPYNLDIIGFNEVPDGDWTARVGKVLGMEHIYVGKISSANHKDKYKSILSRTPLEGSEEHKLTGRGWNPASVARATTYKRPVCALRAMPGFASTPVLKHAKTNHHQSHPKPGRCFGDC